MISAFLSSCIHWQHRHIFLERNSPFSRKEPSRPRHHHSIINRDNSCLGSSSLAHPSTEAINNISHGPHVPIEFSQIQPETTGRCSFKYNSHTDSRAQNAISSGCPVMPLSTKMQFLIISDNKRKQGGYKHSTQGLGPISETSRLLFRVFWRRGLPWNRELEQ